MTKEQLEAKANRIVASAKAVVELRGEFPLTILIYVKDGWRRLPLPKELEFLLNDGKAKDLIFRAVRDTVQQSSAEGVIFGSETWRGEATPEGMKHVDTPEWKRLHDFGFEKLVQRGWIKRSECFTVTAQSATDVLIVSQAFQRTGSGSIQLLQCNRYWLQQSGFGGRQKMFGDLRFENLGSDAATKGTARQ